MFSHVMIGADDIEKSKAFYDAIMPVLGYKEGVTDDKGRVFYFGGNSIFCLTKPIDGQPACGANGGTIGFSAESNDLVNEWHKVGLKSGGMAIEDPPGIREGAGRQLYLAYLRDPSGNKICATHMVS